MKSAVFIFVAVLVITNGARAQRSAVDSDRIYVDRALAFVREYPIPSSPPATPADVVRLWVRIEGLANLVDLYRLGIIPRPLMPETNLRLDIHAMALPFRIDGRGDDELVLLTAMVRLHAEAARRAIRALGRPTSYRELADHVISHGRFLAGRVAARYAPGEPLIPVVKPPAPWGAAK